MLLAVQNQQTDVLLFMNCSDRTLQLMGLNRKCLTPGVAGCEASSLWVLFGYLFEGILAGDEAQAGATIPADVDRTHIVHPADIALASGAKLAIVGIVHVNQFHPCADRILLTQLL